MATIRVEADEKRNLTVNTVLGAVTTNDLAKALENFYTKPTLYLLWDFTDADVSAVPTHELKNLLSLANLHAHKRIGGKTALLAPGELAFGMGRVYVAFTDIYKLPLQHAVFKDREQALTWVLEGEQD